MRQRGVFETSPCKYFHDISSISKSIDNRTLLYICVFIYYSRTDRCTPWSWTMFQPHYQKALGTSCFFGGGRGRGVLCSCNRTFFVTCLISHWASKRRTPLARDLFFLEHWVLSEYSYFTAFAVHYDKIRIHLRGKETNSAKIHSLARIYEHLSINQIWLRFLQFNQHSITLLGIHMGHWAYKRGKYTFINTNIKVINTILTYIQVQALID